MKTTSKSKINFPSLKVSQTKKLLTKFQIENWHCFNCQNKMKIRLHTIKNQQVTQDRLIVLQVKSDCSYLFHFKNSSLRDTDAVMSYLITDNSALQRTDLVRWDTVFHFFTFQQLFIMVFLKMNWVLHSSSRAMTLPKAITWKFCEGFGNPVIPWNCSDSSSRNFKL